MNEIITHESLLSLFILVAILILISIYLFKVSDISKPLKGKLLFTSIPLLFILGFASCNHYNNSFLSAVLMVPQIGESDLGLSSRSLACDKEELITSTEVFSLDNLGDEWTRGSKKASNIEKTASDTETVVNNDIIYNSVDIMPDFPGGDKALREYLRSIPYPKSAREFGIEGKVYIRFVINKRGKVIDAELVRGVHSSLDKVSLRHVRNMPDWEPGKQNGIAVSVRYVVPLKFKLG